MDTITVGQAQLLTFKFTSNPTFPIAPRYNVILDDDSILLSGVMTVSATPGGWDANITLPTTFITATGNERVTVEAVGTDSSAKVRSVEREFRVIDASDDWNPVGILTRQGYDFTDTLVLPSSGIAAADISVTLTDMYDTEVMAAVNPTIDKVTRLLDNNAMPDRFGSPRFSGYKYALTIPASSVVYPTLTRNAYQVQYTVTQGATILKYESHALYRLNGRWLAAINSIRSFLDKARLFEIDPTLQWQDDEICQYLIEGMNYINAFPDVLTYYTVDDCPESLTLPLWYAAAFHGLNARYLAEGLTAFEFSGLSTQLTVDRKDAIAYKIDEIKEYLISNLTKIKKAVVSTSGVGTPVDTATVTARPLGILGLTANPANNMRVPAYRRNFNRF